MKRKHKLLVGVLAAVLLVGLLSSNALADGFVHVREYTPGMFRDVDESAWYAPAVRDVYEMGLMNGTSSGFFSPNGTFTVAQALTVAGRMYDIYYGGKGEIPSETGHWDADALKFCLDNGIVESGLYEDYQRPATRAEMAAIIAGAMPDEAWEAINSVTELPDVFDVTDNHEAIFKLYNAGVLSGSDDYGSFNPDQSIKRSEVAAIVARCADPSQRKTLNLKPASLMGAPKLSVEQMDFVKRAYAAFANSDVDELEKLAESDILPEFYRDVLKPYNQRRAAFLATDDYRNTPPHDGETYRIDFDGEQVGLGLKTPDGKMVMQARFVLDPADNKVRTLSFQATNGNYNRILFITRVIDNGSMHMMTSYYKDDRVPADGLGLRGSTQVMFSRDSRWDGDGFDVSEVMYTGTIELDGYTRVLKDGRATFTVKPANEKGKEYSGYALVDNWTTFYISDSIIVTASPENGTGLRVHTMWIDCGPYRYASFRTPEPAPADGFTNDLWYKQFPFAVAITGPTYNRGPDTRYVVDLFDDRTLNY